MTFVLGVGLSARGTADDVRGLWADAADALGLGPDDVGEVWTLDRHAEDDALRVVARQHGWAVRSLPAGELAGQPVPAPSSRVAEAVGTPSVAEAAVLAAGGDLVRGKTARGGATLAVGRLRDLAHHGDDEARAEGVDVDLAVNVAVPEPPAFVRSAVEASLAGLAAYPDAAPTAARAAAHLGVPSEALLLTNGAAQAFSLVAAAHRWRAAVVVHPQFTEPEAALRAAGARVHRHLLAAPYALDPAALHARHPEADLVVVGNPTNPTSVLHPSADVLACRPVDGVLLVDEAFVDTCSDPGQSVLARSAAPGSGTLVVRSLTKTFGLAGLRAGLVVGDPALVARLRAVQPHWSVSSPALAAVDACLTPEGDKHAEAQRTRLVANAAHLAAGLRRVGLTVGEPDGPFVLAHGTAVPALRTRWRAHGIATRSCASFPGLDDGHVRLAARDADVVAPLLALAADLLPAPSKEQPS